MMKNIFSRALLTAGIFLSAGCASSANLYDKNFQSDRPPLYLKAEPEKEPSLSKIVLKSVAPGSQAEAAGFRNGDQVLAVDGEPVNNSAGRLYQLLLDLHEKQFGMLSMEVRRGYDRLDLKLEPKYIPSLHYNLVSRDKIPVRSVQFLKDYVSDEGYTYSALYDFREKIKIRAHCHLWGENLLVLEIFVVNDAADQFIRVDPSKVTVRDRFGYGLKTVGTDGVIGRIYNMEALNSILTRRFDLRKKEAARASAEMNALCWKLNKGRLKAAKLPPYGVISGMLMYDFDARMAPVTVEARVGKEVFSGRFEIQEDVKQPYYMGYDSGEDESWAYWGWMT